MGALSVLLRRGWFLILLATAALIGIGYGVYSATQDSLPEGALAQIGEQTVPASEFDHWFMVAGKLNGGAQGALPEPPNYANCVAAKRTANATATEDQLKQQCAQDYRQLREQVIQFLVTRRWIESEAQAQDVTAEDAEITARLDELRGGFENEEAFQTYLRSTGLSLEDLLLRIKLEVLTRKLQTKALPDVKPVDTTVTEAEIRAYYKENKADLPLPYEQAKEGIRQALELRKNAANNQLEARYGQRLFDKYRPRTVCAEDFKAAVCSNGPKPKSTTINR